ncbi:MAG: hypothetical protein P8181_12005 [bacterium]
MKAVVYEKYGSPDVLEPREVDTPAVADGGVLIRVRAAAVNRFPTCFRGVTVQALVYFEK